MFDKEQEKRTRISGELLTDEEAALLSTEKIDGAQLKIEIDTD